MHKLRLVQTSKCKMQNMWFHLFHHSPTGRVWTFVVQAGNEMQHQQCTPIAQKEEKEDGLIKGIVTVRVYFCSFSSQKEVIVTDVVF